MSNLQGTFWITSTESAASARTSNGAIHSEFLGSVNTFFIVRKVAIAFQSNEVLLVEGDRRLDEVCGFWDSCNIN